ncbi:MAG: hypothetical protein II336_06585 [Loktanella sp.]|nr:hypothetical protein [Loktanella sp.]
MIWASVKTNSYSIAIQKALGVWSAYIERWAARLAGRDGDAAEKFRAAQHLTGARGCQFLSVDKVQDAPLAEVLRRVEASRSLDVLHDEEVAAALPGSGLSPPVDDECSKGGG